MIPLTMVLAPSRNNSCHIAVVIGSFSRILNLSGPYATGCDIE